MSAAGALTTQVETAPVPLASRVAAIQDAREAEAAAREVVAEAARRATAAANGVSFRGGRGVGTWGCDEFWVRIVVTCAA